MKGLVKLVLMIFCACMIASCSGGDEEAPKASAAQRAEAKAKQRQEAVNHASDFQKEMNAKAANRIPDME